MIEEDEKRIRPTDHEADFVPFTIEGDKTDFIVDEEDSKMKLGEIEAEINPVIAIPFTCTPQGDDVMATVEVDENKVDEDLPVVTLNGDNPMILEVGDKYEEPGATAINDAEGDLTKYLEITCEVNTDEVGTYEVVYTVSDAAGNEAEETRIVSVTESGKVTASDYFCVFDNIIGERTANAKVTPTVSVPNTVDPNGTILVEDVNIDIEFDLTGSLGNSKSSFNPLNWEIKNIIVEVDDKSVNMVGENGVAISETLFKYDAEFVDFLVGEDDGEIIGSDIEGNVETVVADMLFTYTPEEDIVVSTVKVEELDEVAPEITLNGENPK